MVNAGQGRDDFRTIGYDTGGGKVPAVGKNR